MPHVHLAFGFHVNLYHSFRGDTPDDRGFGGDIRIIRNTLAVLDAANRRGVAAKGTWDFENAYSLEQILPKHAPDIMDAVRRRAQQNGDENILMGYNNGAMGALDGAEFAASVEWAASNRQGSGLDDVFGSHAPLIRPQEVMFTPSNAAMYKALGVQGVCLYYSAIPFDSFRTLIPLLPEEQMFNPLNYQYGQDSITIIPTLNHGDLIDYGSLTYLLRHLHHQQQIGAIAGDVLVFVNMDADSEYWFGYDMPGPLKKLPNMGGLAALIKEAEKLPYVVFNTPYHYLQSHPPRHTVSFMQDVADGSFDGYSSWAEKPFNRLIWSRVERARRFAAEGEADAGFDERVRLLSTTHFGLSSPVLNIDRERTALTLSRTMQQKAKASLPVTGQLLLKLPAKSTFFSACLQFEQGALADGMELQVTAEGLCHHGFMPLRRHPDGSVCTGVLLGRTRQAVQVLPAGLAALPADETPETACAVEADVDAMGGVGEIRLHGQPVLKGNTLSGFITYRGTDYPVRYAKPVPFGQNGLSGITLRATLDLPGQTEGGYSALSLFSLADEPYLFVAADIQYPTTREDTAIFNEIAALNRLYDPGWQQTAVLQLQPALTCHIQVVKRNFCGHVTRFPVADFGRACPENDSLDSFNHQLTGGLVGLCGEGETLLVANARQVLGSMAHCPMRLRRQNGQDAVAMNPFGSYCGKQRKHPTYGSGLGGKVAIYSAPQYQPLAPAYNGARETALLALAFGEDAATLDDLAAFADGAVLAGNDPLCKTADLDHVTVHAPAQAIAGGEAKKSMTRSIPLGLQLRIALASLVSKLRR